MTKIEKVISFLSYWISVIALAVLAVAGMLHLIGGVDGLIAYPVTILTIALLVKELISLRS